MTILYHNPRCSKSRQTLALLEENNIDVTIVEYLKHTPDSTEIKSVLKKLGKNAIDILRKNEQVLKERNIKPDLLTESELISLMTEHPILIERPIVVTETAARLGRPPESVLELFENKDG